jgi:predicted acetyltransferase
MTVSIRPCPEPEKSQLFAMLQRCLAELSKFGEVDLSYPYFDSYWQDVDRWPYLIFCNRQLAGFALVNSWSPSGLGTDFAMAEFYVAPAFRRQKLGRGAFDLLIRKHPGQWELSVFDDNTAALMFWQRSLGQSDLVSQLEHPSATVFRFRAVPS